MEGWKDGSMERWKGGKFVVDGYFVINTSCMYMSDTKKKPMGLFFYNEIFDKYTILYTIIL